MRQHGTGGLSAGLPSHRRRGQESICGDAASFDLPASHLASCIKEARRAASSLAHTTRLLRACYVQANECWESLASAEEACPGVDDELVAPTGASNFRAEHYKTLKALLRLLEDRIARETPQVRARRLSLQASPLAYRVAPAAHARSLQTSDGVTHPAEFLFGMLSDLSITAETLPQLLVRRPGPHRDARALKRGVVARRCAGSHRRRDGAACRRCCGGGPKNGACVDAQATLPPHAHDTVHPPTTRAGRAAVASSLARLVAGAEDRLQARWPHNSRRERHARSLTRAPVTCRSLESKSTATYRVHLRNGEGRAGGPCLSFWCMVPGVCMRDLQTMGVRSIVLTSGTLSPMESFAHELVRRLPRHVVPDAGCS